MPRELGWQRSSAIDLDETLATARCLVAGSMGRGPPERTCNLGLGREEELLKLLRLQRLDAFQMVKVLSVIGTEVLDLLGTNRFVGRHFGNGLQQADGS